MLKCSILANPSAGPHRQFAWAGRPAQAGQPPGEPAGVHQETRMIEILWILVLMVAIVIITYFMKDR